MLKKQVIGIGLITLLIVLVIYSRIEHNTEQNIENLSYQELEEEFIKLEDEKHLDMSKKEKADMERKYYVIMQELEKKDRKERDDKKADELIKMYKSKKAEVDFKELGTGYWDPDLNKWVEKGSEPPKKTDNSEPR